MLTKMIYKYTTCAINFFYGKYTTRLYHRMPNIPQRVFILCYSFTVYFYTTLNPNFILSCHLLQFLGNLKYHIFMHYSKFYFINRIGRCMESWVEPRPCWMTIQLIVAHKFHWSQIISFNPLIDGTFHVVHFILHYLFHFIYHLTFPLIVFINSVKYSNR